EFNDPNAAGLHGSIFAAQVRQFVGEVLTRDRPQCGRFSDALRPFENQAAIGLHRWSENPCDSRDEPARTDGARVFRIVDAKIGRQPSIQALDSIPTKALQVDLHGVKWMISSYSLDGLP